MQDQTNHRAHRFFYPRSIALVGASADPSIIRGRLVVSIVDGGYQGELYPVTRSNEQILGLKCYSSVSSLPRTPDLAVIMVPAPVVPQLLEECAEKGIGAALILSSGFNEQGDDEGRARESELRRIADTYSMVVCGPNAEGFFNPAASLTATFSPALRHRMVSTPRSEPAVGIVSQSGGVGFAIYNRGVAKGLSASYVVSTGNELDLDVTEIVDYLISDPLTSVAALFVEGLKDAPRFIDVAERALALRKPLVMAKVGRSQAGRRASLSHTATLVGRHSAYQSILTSHGVTLVDDLDQLVDVSHAFSRFTAHPAKGKRVAILTASGGAGIWVADACVAAGLDISELDEDTRNTLREMMPAYGSEANPIDITAQGVYTFGFSRPLDSLLNSSSVDMVIVVSSAIVPDLIERDREALAALAQTTDKPVMFCAYTTLHPEVIRHLTAAGFPVTNSMPNAALALSAWADYCAHLDRPVVSRASTSAGCDNQVLQSMISSGEVLCEYRARRVLNAAGIESGACWLVRSESEALVAYRKVRGPVALKVQSALLVHKSDVGGVQLGLSDADAVKAGFHTIMEAASRRVAHEEIDGVLVQPMARPGTELIVGIDTDADFGPVLVLGMGGVWVEIIADVQITPVPVNRDQARRMLERLEGRALLLGARGRPAADIDALVTLMMALSSFADTYREHICEVDLNPVIVHAKGEGLTIADALMVKHGKD